MTGYCLLSCGKCILPTTRTVASAASVSEGEVNGEVSPSTMNSTETDMDTAEGEGSEFGEVIQEGAEDSSNSDGDSACVDEYPPDVDTQYTCEDQAGFGKCDQGWMEGYCLASCEKCTLNTTTTTNNTTTTTTEGGEATAAEPSVESEGEGEDLVVEEGEVLANGTLVLSNCTDEKSPLDSSSHSCGAQKDFGKCDEGWMEGYCLLSCGKCVQPTTRQVASAASTTNVVSSTVNATQSVENAIAEDQNLRQAFNASVVSSDGNTAPSTVILNESSCTDEYPPDVDTQYTCEDQAGFGKCEEGWMEGYCLASCDKCNTTSQRTS